MRCKEGTHLGIDHAHTFHCNLLGCRISPCSIIVFGLFVLAIWGIIELFGWLKKQLVAWAKKQD
jgi:hypothetical protein